MWCLIAITFVLAVVTADKHEPKSALIGSPICQKGPEIWCKSLSVAKQCGAVRHCIDAVWSKQTVPIDTSPICDECKEMVAEARTQLQSNQTKEELREVLEGTCRIYFPIKSIANKCIELVNDYLEEYIDILASRMDPDQVCSVVWLCNAGRKLDDVIKSNSDDAVLRLLKAKKDDKALRWDKAAMNSPYCQECVKTITDFQQMIQAEGKDGFVKRLIAVCQQAPALDAQCEQMVGVYGPEIYAFVLAANPSMLCQLSGMCSELLSNKPLPVRSFKDPECDFCQQLVEHFKNIMVANSTEAEVKESLLSICENLKGLKASCTQYVNEYFDDIYNFLTNEMDPQLMCQALGICQMTRMKLGPLKKVPLTGSVQMAALLPAQMMIDVMDAEANELTDDKVMLRLPENKNFVRISLQKTKQAQLLNRGQVEVESSKGDCLMCEYALHQLQQMLGDNATQDEIEHAMDRLCEMLPKTITDECEGFVNVYGPAMCALLAQEIDPSVICVELKICKPPKVKPTNSLTGNFKLIQGMGCTGCRRVVEYLDKLISRQDIDKDITHRAETLCKYARKDDQDYCRALVETYGPYLIQLLTTMVGNSEGVCQAVDICPRTNGQVHLLGGSKCTFGPTYWCASRYHAKACHAVAHCEKIGWMNAAKTDRTVA